MAIEAQQAVAQCLRQPRGRLSQVRDDGLDVLALFFARREVVVLCFGDDLDRRTLRRNQTLAVAVQWGTAGIILLYAMWLVHLRMFRGDDLVAWIGLLVVVQNIFTSLFNSHLFDFHEGWMYVLGVGVAGGMTLAGRQLNAHAERAGSS